MPEQAPLEQDSLDSLLVEALEEAGDLAAVERRILRAAKTLFGADICTLFALNPITGEFISPPESVGELRQTEEKTWTLPRSDGLTRRILERKLVVARDLDQEPDWQSPFSRQEGIRAFAALSLGVRPHPKPFAALYIDFREPRQFSPVDILNLERFAARASLLLQSSWRLFRYRQVIGMGQGLDQANSIAGLFARLEEQVRNLLDSSFFFLLAIYSQSSHTLDLHYRFKGEIRQRSDCPLTPGCERLLAERRSLTLRHDSPEWEPLGLSPTDFEVGEPDDPRSQIFVPLLHQGVPLGVLSVQHRRPHAYDSEDLHILELVAKSLASSLLSFRMIEDLAKLNQTGQVLTGEIDPAGALERIIEKILAATGADLVLLYPYHAETSLFDLPPYQAGALLEPSFPQPTDCQPGDIPYLTVDLAHPLFLAEAGDLMQELPGGRADFESAFQKRERVESLAAIPLQVGGDSVGALYIDYRYRQSFAEPQRQLLHGLAVFAAIAIKNSRRFGEQGRRLGEQERRHQREAEVLQGIDKALSQTFKLEAVLQVILEHAYGIFGAENACIFLMQPDPLQPEKSQFQPVTAKGPDAERNQAWHFPRGGPQGLTRWVFDHHVEVVRVDDAPNDPRWKEIFVDPLGDTVSELDAALMTGGEVVGVLNFESPRRGAFSAEDERFVKTLAGQVVLAVRQAQIYEQAERRYKQAKAGEERLAALQNVSQKIVAQSADPDQVMKAIVVHAQELTRSKVASLDLYEGGELARTYHFRRERSGPVPDVERTEPSADRELVRGIMRHVAKTREPYRTAGDAQSDLLYKGAQDIHSEIAVPLLGESGELIGVLDIESEELLAFDQKNVELLKLFADEAVIAIQTARSYERFKALVELGQKLGELSDPDHAAACEIAAKGAARQCRAQSSVRIYDPEAKQLVLVKRSDSDKIFLPERQSIDEGLNGLAFREDKSRRIDDARRPPAWSPPLRLLDASSSSLLVAPITLRDERFGTLGLTHPQVGYFKDADEQLINGLARLLAITLHRLKSIKREKQLLEAHEQAKAAQWLGDAAWGLAHRLSDDLGLVKTNVNKITRAMKDKGWRDPRIAQNLSDITRDVLHVMDLSVQLKQEAPRLGRYEPEVVDVAAKLHIVLDELRAHPPAVEFILETAENLAPAYANPDHVLDILRNLVKNALEAMPDGGRVILSAHNAEYRCVIQISDTGTGISSDNLQKIFNFLYSTKGSSGFGLWSAEKKAQANGGSLKVDSRPGEGSTFTLTLPRADQRLEEQFGV
jgi:GAF domain-containing protein